MAIRIQRLNVPVSALGEGPVWSQREQRLYFVDITAGRLLAYRPDDETIEHWELGGFVGSLAECRSGGLLVSLTDRVARFDPKKKGPESLETVAILERDRPLNRLNDGRADPFGRFWVGSMQADEKASRGRLWCVSPNGEATAVRDEIGVSNSLAFDRARNRMYFADSFARAIEVASLDEKQMPGPWQVFARAEKGAPDGSCIDADGYLWNAQWGAWRVVRYAPDGKVDRVIEMPTSRPSACTFGGPELKTLFVTSATHMMTAKEKESDPQAGSLYRVEIEGVQGRSADLVGM